MKTPVAIAILVVVLALGAYLVLIRPAQAPAPAGQTQETMLKDFTLRIEGKKLVEGPATITVQKGDMVAILATADEAEELHLHGYDTSVDLEPGVQAELRFVADTAGQFPIELEESKTDIAVLEVLP